MLKRVAATVRSSGTGRTLAATSHILSVGTMAATVAAAYWILVRTDVIALQTVAQFVGVVAGGGLLVSVFDRLGMHLSQRARDVGADKILAALKAGHPVPSFALYLRPFASTDSVSREEISIAPLAGQGGRFMSAASRFELEKDLRGATHRIGPLVGLGLSLEHDGAGRITVEDTAWKDAIATLMDASALILLLPSQREGTRFEVERILSRPDLIEKTLVIDPPDGSNQDLEAYDHAEEWRLSRRIFADNGYALPENNLRGRAYWFGDQKTPAASSPLRLGQTGAVRRLIRKLNARRRTRLAGTP